ncbi:hypothetical protein [Nonomuraea roseoviolacea]|uniref:Uncharacterized protein n=1 Tax=Nonomuraea roseoviolacea subsp. carminata TaxID=160689 RepID=A0ABT1K9D3_9ACTN|nr:hypothetical protein [Nonomuraea roseoviolacea]MCP2350627.1 hypothetical protein [Nonomuraea roseoviolacea subsp. carminata]
MTVLPVSLTVGDKAYDLGSVEVLDSDSHRWAQLERFLRAVADTLNEGYTLRPMISGEPDEIAGLPVEVRRLVHAVDSMRDKWAEADEARRQELWQVVHEANDAVWSRAERE